MRLFAGALCLLFLAAAITGCGPTTPPAEPTVATLVTDFSCGASDNAELVQTHELSYEGELTIATLAQGLTDLTGYNFAVTGIVEDGIATVDWAAESSLIGGITEDPQEEFFVYDADSANWFMMDSLYQTILANLEVTEVYYTMDGGQDLYIEHLYPVESFGGTSYCGSPFYYAHADVRGDLSQADAQAVLEEHLADILAEEGMALSFDSTLTAADGAELFIFVLGQNSSGVFSALEQYGVALDGTIYVADGNGGFAPADQG